MSTTHLANWQELDGFAHDLRCVGNAMARAAGNMEDFEIAARLADGEPMPYDPALMALTAIVDAVRDTLQRMADEREADERAQKEEGNG